MLAHPSKKDLKCCVAAVMVITLAGVCLAPLAFAGISVNTIDPVAVITDDGRHIVVTGPIACTEGETAPLRVTLTQRATGGCSTGPHPYHVHR
jgi:hypothetical protein